MQVALSCRDWAGALMRRPRGCRSDGTQRQKGMKEDWLRVTGGCREQGLRHLDNVKLSLGCLSEDSGPEFRKGSVQGWRHNLWDGSSQELGSVQGEGRAWG